MHKKQCRKQPFEAMKLVISSIAFFLVLSLSNGGSVSPDPNLPLRAAALGGWLVTEGYIKPSLFDAIPNKHLLDGTQVILRSVQGRKYLRIDNSTTRVMVSSGIPAASDRESLFRLWRINETTFNFRGLSKRFMGLNAREDVVVAADTPSTSETFQIHINPLHPTRVRIKAPNGFFLQVGKGKYVSADYKKFDTTFGDKDPSVFLLNITGQMLGEYQVTNGYGPLLAPKVMMEHWSTFIVEKDFEFMKKNGLNSVRIPVGWWIAYDPNPPMPFVGGSLLFLDKAFSWAEKYGVKVIVDLHGAPGGQNCDEHSGNRDGHDAEWGQTEDTIQQTLYVIDFLVARYVKSPSLFAMSLLNEPTSDIPQKTMVEFYKAGYDVVRKHSATIYVIFSNRFRSSSREFFEMTKKMARSVIDVHYYHTYDTTLFGPFTVDQNIDYVYKNQTEKLRLLQNGPLIFVGEWTTEMLVKNATKKQYERFGKAQLRVFDKESFGWAHWSLKNARPHWSLEWMINNAYFKINI